LLNATEGSFLDRTLVFDTIAGNNASLVGVDLFVQLSILGNSGPGNADQIAFDAVTVTSTPIPEPTAVAGVVGLAALVLRRRRSC
jgi:MYXO-CTERM domain-containing protein